MTTVNKRNVFFMLFLLISLGIFLTFSYQNGQMKSNRNHIKPDEPHHIEATAKATVDKVSIDLAMKKNLLTDLIYIRQLEIVSIGDSLTAGVGDEKRNGGYVGVLKGIMNTENQMVNISNFGKNGHRTDQLLDRLASPGIIEKITTADIVLITIGANDIMRVFQNNFMNLQIENFNNAQDGYQERLTEVFQNIERINPEAEVYLIGFYNPFKSFFPEIDELEYIVQSWNDIGENITEEFENAYFIPTKDLFDGNTTSFLAEDNFHLNQQGYERMAKRISQYIMHEEGELDDTNATQEE